MGNKIQFFLVSLHRPSNEIININAELPDIFKQIKLGLAPVERLRRKVVNKKELCVEQNRRLSFLFYFLTFRNSL